LKLNFKIRPTLIESWFNASQSTSVQK